MCKLKEFWENIKHQILIKYKQARGNRRKSSSLWCIKNRNRGCRDKKESEPYYTIAKLAISKHKCGKYKNLEMIFETELEMKSKEHK